MYGRILVPVEDSEASRRGLGEAFELALRLGSTLRLLQVTSDFPFVVEMANPNEPGEYRKSVRRRAEELLEGLALQASAARIRVETRVRVVKTTGLAMAIVREAVQSRCELIVMATNRRRGLARAGSGQRHRGRSAQEFGSGSVCGCRGLARAAQTLTRLKVARCGPNRLRINPRESDSQLNEPKGEGAVMKSIPMQAVQDLPIGPLALVCVLVVLVASVLDVPGAPDQARHEAVRAVQR
jgi:nucleotide-binding universal stress UspA family protein